MSHAKVTFDGANIEVQVAVGTTLMAAAATAGVSLEAPCGGLGTCGRCTVVAKGALDEPGADERVLLGEARLAENVRLACRARALGDVVVERLGAPKRESLRVVEVDGVGGAITIEPPAARGITGEGRLLGAVVDIGTTTVVVAIVDLETAEQLAVASSLNPQHPFGHDVMTRISHVAQAGPESLREPIVRAIESLAADALASIGESPECLREMAIAGNTTMIHLLLGIDPAPLGVAPYEPAFLEPVDRRADTVGFERLGSAGVYVLPGISAFVGADVTAGLIATGIAEHERSVLLVDLGTNGEMVLRTPNGLVGASTAAGPALEGASIAYGMRAEHGAIERVTLAGDDMDVAVIGATAPTGLCGSGLLDLIAVLLDVGVIDYTGRLKPDAEHPLSARVEVIDGVRAFRVAQDVYLTQRDVRQVQLANAAIASGIDMLLDHAQVDPASVDELVVAGGFGYHVKAEALVRMGMVPAIWVDRISFAGNTAKAGALMALVDTEARRKAEAVAMHVSAIDLAGHPDFQTKFVSAMHFPKT